jgi:hypothetical protein
MGTLNLVYRDHRQQADEGYHDHGFYERETGFVRYTNLHSLLLSSLRCERCRRRIIYYYVFVHFIADCNRSFDKSSLRTILGHQEQPVDSFRTLRRRPEVVNIRSLEIGG